MEQKQNARLGFFRRIFLAITDFRLYPFVQREKTAATTSYFVFLLLLITLFLALSFSSKVLDGVAAILENYEETVPEFALQNGVLSIDEKVYELDRERKVVIDTSVDTETFAKTDNGKEVLYSTSFLVINRDGVVYGNEGNVVGYLFRAIRTDVTKSSLHEFLTAVNEDWTVKLAFTLSSWLIMFLIYFVVKMLNVLFLILIAYILNIIFGMKLKFSNYYRVVVYALTLPLIVEMVSILYLGRVPEYAVVAYQVLAYVYIFYALRALKLDILIISAPGVNFKEKLENMIHKMEQEAEEKLEKEAKETKEEEQKEEETKQEKEEDKKDEK
ncbi:MAG: DUF1189 family protein [Clostridia bacterium]|nr:DUF1189 family protein [Clostridia bacterium]